MRELPQGWIYTQFSEVLESIIGGGTPSKTNPEYFEGSIPFMTVKDLHERFPRDTIDHISESAVSDSATSIVPEDTLIVATRMSLGKIVRPKFQTAINQDLKALFLTDGLDKTYVEYWWRSQSTHIQSLGTGTTVKGIRLEDIKGLEFPVAPSPEQKRIADKLDALLARVDATRERLDHIPTLLKRFRQSVLAAATSGRLTEDWRAENPSAVSIRSVHNRGDTEQLPPKGQVGGDVEGWLLTEVQAVATIGTGSTPLRSNAAYFSSIGTPWITSAATSKNLVMSAEEFVTEYAIKDHRLKIYPIGTLLIAMYGEGKTRGQVTELGIEATINQACAAIIVDEDKANRMFVKLVLQANYFEMRELAEGGNQPNLNLSKIKEFPLTLPTLPEQTEIVRRVEALFALADKVEARYTTARAQVDKLTPALLAKAFRGELVEQDPKDEPAEELLARLREVRENEPVKKRGRTAKPRME